MKDLCAHHRLFNAFSTRHGRRAILSISLGPVVASYYRTFFHWQQNLLFPFLDAAAKQLRGTLETICLISGPPTLLLQTARTSYRGWAAYCWRTTTCGEGLIGLRKTWIDKIMNYRHRKGEKDCSDFDESLHVQLQLSAQDMIKVAIEPLRG